jgi:type IV pilus assembly protein PilB
MENTNEKPTLVVLTYGLLAQSHTDGVVQQSGIGKSVTIRFEKYSSLNGLSCDIAVAFLGPGDNITSYVNDVTSLKIVRQVPVVVAMIAEEEREAVAKHTAEMPADDVVYLPVLPSDFGRLIQTHIVAIEIARNKRATRLDLARTQQALGEMLVEHSLITPLQLKKALDYQNGTDLRLGDTLVLLGYITEEQKMHFLGSQLGVDLATPKQYASADLNVVALIPERIAKQYTCIALERDNDILIVAMVDVLNLQLLDTLRDTTDLTINPILGKHEDIKTSIERYYRDINSQRDASDLMADIGDDLEFVRK